MQDSVRDAFMVALKELGYSMNTTDVGELEEAKKAKVEAENKAEEAEKRVEELEKQLKRERAR